MTAVSATPAASRARPTPCRWGRHPVSRHPRAGAALLLSVLVLIVVITIVIQISIGTITDARVSRNDVGLTSMELAIESALLQVYEDLAADGEAAAGAGAGAGAGLGGAGGLPGEGGAPPEGGAPAGGGDTSSSDSKMDDWARPSRHDVNEIQLRVLVQDEDSKYNILNLLNPDPELADKALRRVASIIDRFREGTREDVGASEAADMARAMAEYMRERSRSLALPDPELLSDREDLEDQGLPLTLAEFASLEEIPERLFRDYRDEDGRIVHSLGSFLTVWSSLAPLSEAGPGGAPGGAGAAGAGGGAGSAGGDGGGAAAGSGGAEGQSGGGEDSGAGGESADAGGSGAEGGSQGGGAGGWGVNVNTAPPAVLKSLIDDRDVPLRFWDEVIEYRNLEEEKDPSAREEESEPLLDEWGEEIIERRFFDTLDELSELDGWGELDAEQQNRIRELLTTRSAVFSIFVTARKPTGDQGDVQGPLIPEEQRGQEEQGAQLTRTIRSVVWRREGDEGWEVVPIVRWEVLDYVPYEVLDYPDEER